MHDPIWWQINAISGLIGVEGVFIGFRDIVLPVGYISIKSCVGFTTLGAGLQHLGLILVFLSDIQVRLSSGRTSALGISYYQYCHQLFLHFSNINS